MGNYVDDVLYENDPYYSKKIDRPLGITLIAVLQIIGALISVILLFILPNLFDLSIISKYLGEHFLFIIYVSAIIGIPISLLLAHGLLNGKEWARFATFLYEIISIITSLIRLNILGIIIPIIILTYLNKPHVKNFFKTDRGIKPKVKALIIIWILFLLVFECYVAVLSNPLYLQNIVGNESKKSQEQYLVGNWQSETGSIRLTFYSNDTCTMMKENNTYKGTWEYTSQINWINLKWNNYHEETCHFIGEDLGYNCMFDCSGDNLLVKIT